ncbi:MAG: hypothetical protein WAW96_09435 [Alphaproteobacteria bacterium]
MAEEIEIVLNESAIRFCAHQDEEHFFSWLQATPEVRNVVGRGNGLHVTIAKEVSDDSLRSLIALLRRYDVSMKCLRVFTNRRNESWFKNKEMFWYQAVFED